MMALTSITVVDTEVGEFNIPAWVKDLASFRRWVEEDETLDFGRVGYLKGSVWIDMSKEQLYTHNGVKTELTSVLHRLVKGERLGRYFSDGALLCNVPADVSGQPDGTFVSLESFRTGRVKDVVGRRDGGYVELEGSPDLVVEVVSPGTVRKDTTRLRQAYWEAGITEYWLIDARAEPLKFDILRHTSRGYVASRKPGGWIKSAVLRHSFRLFQALDSLGRPEYTLGVR
jgi:Uma2 family endonuclease